MLNLELELLRLFIDMFSDGSATEQIDPSSISFPDLSLVQVPRQFQ